MTSAARGGLWLGAIRLVTQVVSWGVTVLVARILMPADYGLVELAAVVTGAVEVFSEFGLGSAVVQRPKVTREELSSTFWLSCVTGLGLAGLCAVGAEPAAVAFGEPRVEPIIRVASLGFVIGSAAVVPLSLLSREYRFRTLGLVQFGAVLVSSAVMLVMARRGFGVWTLVIGTLILRSTTTVLVLCTARFRPVLRLRRSDVAPYVRFGLSVMASRTIYFASQRADRIIVGGLLGLDALGHYGFARHLAGLPNDKVIAVVGQVSFPVLSRHQKETEAVRTIYLRFVRYVSVALAPAFVLGALFGEPLVRVVLGERWVPLATLFRWFCVGQLVVGVTAINSIVHNAQGRPHWVLAVSIVGSAFMLTTVYIAAQFGLAALAVPWVVVYPAVCIAFAAITIRRIGVQPGAVGRELRPALGAGVAALLAGTAAQVMLATYGVPLATIGALATACGAAGAAYVAYLAVAEGATLTELIRLFR